ncbi:hypothetical protein BJX70DRAFT_379408 [Aspergillus crustosus]
MGSRLQITPRTFHHASTATSPSRHYFSYDLARDTHHLNVYFTTRSSDHNPFLPSADNYSPTSTAIPYQILTHAFHVESSTHKTTLAMPQISSQQSHPKEGRRILSEKSANAGFSPARSPVKQKLLKSASPKKLLPSPSFVAQKRSLGQVDGADLGSIGISRVHQRVEMRVEAAAHHEALVRSVTVPENRSTSDAMNMDEQEQAVKEQSFHNINKIGVQRIAKDPETTSLSIPPKTPADPPTRKQFIQEKASLLRNRLQSAMRHVRDPQFDRRVSELEEHSRKYARLSSSGSGSESQIQQHLEQKYGIHNRDDDDNDVIICTPRVYQQTQQEEQTPFNDEDKDETTPTQETHTHMRSQRTDRATSPINMLLSSPIYNPNPTDSFSDDRPLKTTVDTSPSSPQRKKGDGDAVDGLLRLMGRNAATSMEMGL